MIPITIHLYGKNKTTMDAITQLREKSDPLWEQIMDLPAEYNDLDKTKRQLVMKFINEYDHLCTLYNTRIISQHLIQQTRKTTIINAYDRYRNFIIEWRKCEDPDAWKALEKCATNLKH